MKDEVPLFHANKMLATSLSLSLSHHECLTLQVSTNQCTKSDIANLVMMVYTPPTLVSHIDYGK